MLFDSHAHIDSERFDGERDAIIERAKQAGLSLIMNPGADYASSVKAVELSETYDMVYAAVGIHPHDADSVDDMMLSLIEALARKEKVKAIGEIGLDYHYDHSPREVQRKVFIEQIRLAKSLKMPIIIHDREANDDMLRILKEEKAFETGVVMHCFSGSAELARQYVELGAYISIAGPLTFKNNRKTIEVVNVVPLDRLLVETDSPFLTPVPYRGKRNEPAYVEYVADKIAEIKGLTYKDVAEATKKNACKFFGIEE